MGLCNLCHVEEAISKRRVVTERYRSHLEDIDGIHLNVIRQDVRSNYAYFLVVFGEK